MDESILIDVKKLNDIDESDDSFDKDLLIHINAFVPTLNQLGVKTAPGVFIEDESTTWSDLIYDTEEISPIKTWLGLKVRKVFDPPQNGSVMDSLESVISELEWRINIDVDPREE